MKTIQILLSIYNRASWEYVEMYFFNRKKCCAWISMYIKFIVNKIHFTHVYFLFSIDNYKVYIVYF